MYSFFRPLLFLLDPERAHNLTLTWLRWAGDFPLTARLLERWYRVEDRRLVVEAFGLRFKNPIGLAAGYDKNGVAVRGLSALGFGFVEVGTVTLLPQSGNPLPRVHRVPEAHGIINSMGFPNAGVAALQVQKQMAASTRIGINIGKGKDTPLEEAANDYCELLRRVHRNADYVTVNVSSPNTMGLRALQARDAMESLLKAVMRTRDELSPRVPVLVKIAPDLSEAEIDDVLMAVTLSGADGIIATNTTTSRRGVPERYAGLKGGLSGEPLRARSTAVIRYIAEQTRGRLPLIGVGGVANVADALEKFLAGAWLVQIYSGLVYVGPSLVQQLNRGLIRACELEGAQSVKSLRSSM